jgi:hypothetical protein
MKTARRLSAKDVEVLDLYMLMAAPGTRVIHPEGDPTALEAGTNRCAIS